VAVTPMPISHGQSAACGRWNPATAIQAAPPAVDSSVK
jgi:hypothetical protein